MRVYSINNTQPRYNKTQNKSVQNLGYMTQSAQSFGTWLGLGKKVTVKPLDVAKPKASQLADAVIDRLYTIGGKKKPEDFKDFKYVNINYLKEHINEDTAPFAHKLLDQISGERLQREFDLTVKQLGGLVERYKVFPNARKSMHAVVDAHAAHFKGSDYFSMGNLNDILSFRYTGTDMQNRFVEKIAAAKNADGSPRFLGKSFVTSEIFDDYSIPAQEEAFDLVLDHKSVVKIDVTDYKVLTSMVMDLPVEEYAAKRQHATHQIEVEKYLINGADDLSAILKQVLTNVDSLEALKQILPRLKGEHSGTVAAILDDYTPMHKKIFAKSMQLIDRGEMTLEELAHVVDKAGGDVPFRS